MHAQDVEYHHRLTRVGAKVKKYNQSVAFHGVPMRFGVDSGGMATRMTAAASGVSYHRLSLVLYNVIAPYLQLKWGVTNSLPYSFSMPFNRTDTVMSSWQLFPVLRLKVEHILFDTPPQQHVEEVSKRYPNYCQQCAEGKGQHVLCAYECKLLSLPKWESGPALTACMTTHC